MMLKGHHLEISVSNWRPKNGRSIVQPGALPRACSTGTSAELQRLPREMQGGRHRVLSRPWSCPPESPSARSRAAIASAPTTRLLPGAPPRPPSPPFAPTTRPLPDAPPRPPAPLRLLRLWRQVLRRRRGGDHREKRRRRSHAAIRWWRPADGGDSARRGRRREAAAPAELAWTEAGAGGRGRDGLVVLCKLRNVLVVLHFLVVSCSTPNICLRFGCSVGDMFFIFYDLFRVWVAYRLKIILEVLF